MKAHYVPGALASLLIGLTLAACDNVTTTMSENEPDLQELRAVAREAMLMAEKVKKIGKYDSEAEKFVATYAGSKWFEMRAKTFRVLTAAWQADPTSRDQVESTFVEIALTSESSREAILPWMRLSSLRGFGFTKPEGTILDKPTSTPASSRWLTKSLKTIVSAKDHAHRAWAVVEFVNAAGKSRSARDDLAQALTSRSFADEPFEGFWEEFAELCLTRSFPADDE